MPIFDLISCCIVCKNVLITRFCTIRLTKECHLSWNHNPPQNSKVSNCAYSLFCMKIINVLALLLNFIGSIFSKFVNTCFKLSVILAWNGITTMWGSLHIVVSLWQKFKLKIIQFCYLPPLLTSAGEYYCKKLRTYWIHVYKLFYLNFALFLIDFRKNIHWFGVFHIGAKYRRI